jgi:hypothetical protein
MPNVTVTGDRARAYQAYQAVIESLVELDQQTMVHTQEPQSSDGIALSDLGSDSGQLAEPASSYLVGLAVLAEAIGAQLREQAAVISGDL